MYDSMSNYRAKCVPVMMCLSLFSSKQCIIKQLLDSLFVIPRIIKVSVSVISLLPRPWLFWISQKPHPIIVYYHVLCVWACLTHCQQYMYAVRVGRKKRGNAGLRSCLNIVLLSNLDVTSKPGPQLFKMCIVSGGCDLEFSKGTHHNFPNPPYPSPKSFPSLFTT